MRMKEKIETIATKIYRAKNVSYTDTALKDLEKFTKWGYASMADNIEKTIPATVIII